MLDTPLGQWLLVVGLFVLGSLFGSFANVVIYRLPLGKSLLWPGSHCPACGHAIRWYDNVPVFGWLLLNGKCRDCQTAIPVRYPLVEALFGMLLATLGWLEIINGPPSVDGHFPADANLFRTGDWFLTGYYMLLLSTLVVAALIQWDSRRIPRRLLIFTLVCGLLLPLALNMSRPIPLAVRLPQILQWPPTLRTLVEGLVGAGAGLLLGCLAWPAIRHARANSNAPAMLLAMATTGAFLGWQAAGEIAVIQVLGDLLAALIGFAWPQARRVGWCVWLAVAALVWLVCQWTSLSAHGLSASLTATWPCGQLNPLLAAGGVVALVALLDWQIRCRRPATSD